MASAAEQLASSINFSAFSKATELKSRIWFTLGALVIYRLGTYIPIPGIDPGILQDVFSRNAGGILGMFDMFSGGALGRMTIFALNIMPYISASIIIQLLTAVSPTLEALKKEGESGRKKLNQYTRLHPPAVRRALHGQQAVRRRRVPLAAEDQHLGCQPADLRLLSVAVAGDSGKFRSQRAVWLDQRDHGLPRTWAAALYGALCW